MTALERILPIPNMIEVDRRDLDAPADHVWDRLRHGDLACSPVVRALFAIRTLPSQVTRHAPPATTALRVDDLVSTAAKPGFQVLFDAAPHEVVVGAIGKVWQLDIPFRHVESARDFEAFAEPGYIKVAWAIRVVPLDEATSRVEVEVRVTATDPESWTRFSRYWRIIGPASRFIRRSMLGSLGRELGASPPDDQPLTGDELLADAREQLTDAIDIAAPPEAIWPWLVQMGARRGGFYSIDLLDNGGEESARELHPELQRIAVGDLIPASPASPEGEGFEVLHVDAPRALVLGGLFDPGAERQLPFTAARPPRYWHVTWAFVLEKLDERTTRLHVRARASFAPEERLRLAWIRPVHRFMERAQLRHLAARAEGRIPADDWHDVMVGVGGAARMAAALLTPFLRSRRAAWGAPDPARTYPGDTLVTEPRWTWTHGIEIGAPAAEVWPWIAQIGATRAGFYRYQWLENLVGCRLRNAERVHPEWELREGDPLVLHPGAPPLSVVELRRRTHFVAYGPPDERALREGRPWITVSWLFLLEPIAPGRCRFVSRYRIRGSGDLWTTLSFGPALLEPIGSVMDRGMLLGVKARVERARRRALTTDAAVSSAM